MVLCITHSNDHYTIDLVQQALEKSGVPSFRLNTDLFAIDYQLHYSTQGLRLYNQLQSISSEQFTGVWYRKLWDMKVPADLDPAFVPAYIKEYGTYRQLLFNVLQHLPWMNAMEADHAVSGDKLLQLRMARAVGLQVPASIFSNDPAVVKAFYNLCKGSMVMKLHNALSKSMQGDGPFFPTTRVSEAHLDNLDQLTYCPMIFQEYIPKAYELRIAYVDGDCFTGKIPHAGAVPVDWRTQGGHAFQWQYYELPALIQQQLQLLMKKLGLAFGAIDMIRHTNGAYVFLEVNPQGEWGMLQKHLGYPIAETIAAKLINRINND
jgi:glutathione synthase/RimK-type ligase-like ATP-grasp enzyme